MKYSSKLALSAALSFFVVGSALAADCEPKVSDAALVKPGTLIMSTNPTLPPLQYVDQSGELKGMRVDLGNMIAEKLCLKPEYIRIEFSAMIPGLQAGRWDMINTGIFYTEERAKMMQLIPYEQQAISISVSTADKDSITKAEDLEGKTVGVEIGGFEETKAKAFNQELIDKGMKGFTLRTFDNFALAYQALRAGQVEAVVSIDGVAKEYEKRGSFVSAIHGLYPTPVALAFQNKELADAAAKAMEEMRADGSYQKLFDSYGVVPTEGEFVVHGPDSK